MAKRSDQLERKSQKDQPENKDFRAMIEAFPEVNEVVLGIIRSWEKLSKELKDIQTHTPNTELIRQCMLATRNPKILDKLKE